MQIPVCFVIAAIIVSTGCAHKEPARSTPEKQSSTATAVTYPAFWPPSAGLTCERFDAVLFAGSDPLTEDQVAEAIGCAIERAPDEQVSDLLYGLNHNLRVEGGTIRYDDHPLGSGTTFGGLHFSSTRGHIDATGDALRESSVVFSTDAQLIINDASQDVDLLEWTRMPAHGQTGDDNGRPRAPEAAKMEWVAWIKGHMQWVAQHCRSEPIEAVYRFGYALHSIEDVAPHKGRTNPEHSFNAHQGNNPDEVSTNYELAVDMTKRFIEAQFAGPLASCKKVFSQARGSKPSFPNKESIVGRGRDFTLASLIEYRRSWRTHEHAAAQGAHLIRWFSPDRDIKKCSDDDSCIKLLKLLE